VVAARSSDGGDLPLPEHRTGWAVVLVAGFVVGTVGWRVYTAQGGERPMSVVRGDFGVYGAGL
jgi:hypothetical protein